MSTLALLVCLLAADDPLEEIKERIAEMYGNDPVVARDAYQRLTVLIRSPNKTRSAAAKAAVEEYDRRVTKFADSKPIVNESLRINSAKEFYDKDRKPLYANSALYALSIVTKDFGDNELRPALKLQRMQNFALYQTSVTGRDFAQLTMPKLTILTLEKSPITDQAVCALDPANMPELVVLNLIGTNITDKALAGCQLTDIKALYLNDTAVTRDGLKSLTRFTSLQALRMDYRNFDPLVLSQIAEGKLGITQLRLAYTVDEEAAAKALEKFAPAGVTITLSPK